MLHRLAVASNLSEADDSTSSAMNVCGAGLFNRRSGRIPPRAGISSASSRKAYFSSPNTATEPVVPTSTLPSAMTGVMNLLPAPSWSRLPGACVLL